MPIPTHDYHRTVLEAFVENENRWGWNRVRSVFRSTPYRIEVCDAFSEDRYHGISYVVRHEGHPITVFTKWEDCPETLVVGERPRPETPYRGFFERICANLEEHDIDIDYSGVPI